MKKNINIRTVATKEEKEKYISGVWNVLSAGYENVKGGLHFKSKIDLIDNTKKWKVVFCRGEVIAVTVYKAKKGLKLVAFSAGRKFREIAIATLKRIIKRDLAICWMELSEAAEKFVMNIGGDKYIIPSYAAGNVLSKDVAQAEDGVHYIREIMGIPKQKVLLGTIRI